MGLSTIMLRIPMVREGALAPEVVSVESVASMEPIQQVGPEKPPPEQMESGVDQVQQFIVGMFKVDAATSREQIGEPCAVPYQQYDELVNDYDFLKGQHAKLTEIMDIWMSDTVKRAREPDNELRRRISEIDETTT